MKNVGILVSAVLAVCAACTASWLGGSWCDELVVTDSAVNFLRTGMWQSNVWPCCYSPLHSLTAACAVILFGASHQVVATVGCVLAFLASVVILRTMRRRNVFSDQVSESLFAVLFWSGWYFAGQIVNGRPDMMTLLFLAWLLDEMYPPASEKWHKGRIMVKGACLMLTSIYAVPFCILLSTVPCFRRATRKDAIRRTLFLGVGLAIGGIAVVAFYAWQMEIVRFVGWITFFNTLTGECTQSLRHRLLAAYRYDPQALAMIAATSLSALLTPWRRSLRFWRWLAASALIPVVMVFCGRFQSYYAWMFFVPACALLTAVADRLHFSVRIALIAVFLTVFACHRVTAAKAAQKRIAHEAEAADFVARHADALDRGVTVLVADEITKDTSMYYPLLGRKVDLWFRGKETLEAPSDRAKFEIGLSMFISDPDRRSEILATVFRFQRTVPVMPDRALVIFTSPKNRSEVQPVFERMGFAIDDMASENGFSLCRCKNVAMGNQPLNTDKRL